MMHRMMQRTDKTSLMTTKDAAARLGVTCTTVTRLVARGELTPLPLQQRGYVFEKWDVDACAARRQARKARTSQ